MILLSALLASLSGLVAGERPVERAQVELSAVAAVVEAGTIASRASLHPENEQPRSQRGSSSARQLIEQAPVRGARALLRIKQSWLH